MPSELRASLPAMRAHSARHSSEVRSTTDWIVASSPTSQRFTS